MNLNDLKKIKSLDKGFVAESIALFPRQAEQVLQEAANLEIPADFQKINKVVVNGMGGSNLGARILASALKDRLPVPLIIEPGYFVPDYVDSETLYIMFSYSGNTEEPLSTYQEAKKRGAKILGVTAFGEKNKLAGLMKKDNFPGLVFRADNNPSLQPRLGVGYSIFGLLAILEKAGLLEFSDKEKKGLLAETKKISEKFRLEIKANANPAKKITQAIGGKEIVLVAAEFLEGNAHAMRNHLCECSKNFASYLILPELNHYALESLAFPKNNPKNLIFLFFDSALYHPRNRRRSELTQKIVAKNKIKVVEYKLTAKTKFGQALEMTQFGAWVSFYLAVYNNINPVNIPWVDWFKEQLAK